MTDLDLVIERTGHSRLRDLVRARPEYADVVAEMARAFRSEPAPPKRDASPAPTEPTLEQWAFVTTEQLVRDALDLVARVPPDVDAVAAVARSGLVPGTLVATYRHVPLYTVSRGRGVVDPGHGFRLRGHSKNAPRHVLLVDDTAATGQEMPANAAAVRARWPNARITRAVVYCTPQARGQVDLCAALYPAPHYLEWNWPNAGHGALCGFDFDGILCRDDDGAKPLFLPLRRPAPLVVTGRHVSAREATQAWLDKWGVRCERLVMRHFDAPDHYDLSRIAAFKAEHYAASPCVLFAESDPGQAERIAALSGKPVLCPAAGRVFPPPPRPTVAETMSLQSRAASCPHYRKPDCGCRWGDCAAGRGDAGRIALDDCRSCPELPPC